LVENGLLLFFFTLAAAVEVVVEVVVDELPTELIPDSL